MTEVLVILYPPWKPKQQRLLFSLVHLLFYHRSIRDRVSVFQSVRQNNLMGQTQGCNKKLAVKLHLYILEIHWQWNFIEDVIGTEKMQQKLDVKKQPTSYQHFVQVVLHLSGLKKTPQFGNPFYVWDKKDHRRFRLTMGFFSKTKKQTSKLIRFGRTLHIVGKSYKKEGWSCWFDSLSKSKKSLGGKTGLNIFFLDAQWSQKECLPTKVGIQDFQHQLRECLGVLFTTWFFTMGRLGMSGAKWFWEFSATTWAWPNGSFTLWMA